MNEANWDETMYRLYDLEDLERPAVYEDWLERLHPEDRAFADQEFQNALQQKENFDVEFRICHRDGSIHWIRATAIIQKDEQGLPIRMTGINQDLTNLKEIELTLQRQLNAIEASIDGIAILEGDKFLYVNPDHLTMFGYDEPQALIGQSWQKLLSHLEDVIF